jgi:hydrogenase maturation protein HypF
LQTYQIHIKGLVQGVGFRPFVYRIATNLELNGEVDNRNNGVFIKINASEEELNHFIDELKLKAPIASKIEELTYNPIELADFNGFLIKKSKNTSNEITEISPDIAVCEDCLEDLKQQKHRIDYPFINCTNCGPRFTIIKELPYDREKTTMAEFKMCDTCRQEYTNILDRRFHAQPVACNQCGPIYQLHIGGQIIENIEEIIDICNKITSSEGITAIKGLGGYHLMCDAFSETATFRLRNIKKRENKPFAVMCKNIQAAIEIAYISIEEKELLESWKRPIVLLESKNKTAKAVQNGLNTIGIMLPYMPFHYLLFEKLKTNCIVLTSGNISDEPIIIDNQLALDTFSNLTDAVLNYNREIYNRTDDSVVQFINSEQIIRRSRGYAPSSIKVNMETEGIFAAGAELSNTFAVGKLNRVYLSQHIGDLKNAENYEFYEESINRYINLFKFFPKLVVCDLHPDYLSSHFAENYALKNNVPLIKVQHHHAHIASVMTDYQLDEKVIGVSMDGVGLGTDNTIWGGEFFICDLTSFERKYHLESIPVAGSDKVSKEPWRSAISYLTHFQLENIKKLPLYKSVTGNQIDVYKQMLEKQINTISYSSAGRLFDAVAALINFCTVSGFHAEAPMRLESIIQKRTENQLYSYEIKENVVSFRSCFEEIIEDLSKNVSQSLISVKFHNAFIEALVETIVLINRTTKINKVILSGGSFQNKYITKNLIKKLEEKELEVFLPKNVPVNDGGIALGQLIIAAKRLDLGNILLSNSR